MKVVIIGNGIAGITAARNIRKISDCSITVISSETEYFYSRTALMYIFMGHMRLKETQPYGNWFWAKNNIQLKKAYVTNIDTTNQTISTQQGENIVYDKLVLATGSQSNYFGWPGQNLKGVQGLYNYQDLELLEQNTQNTQNTQHCKKAVIVGGGLIGIELAEMLLSRNIEVTILVRESSYWSNVLPAGESQLINQHILKHGVDLKLNSNLQEIIGDENGKAKAVVVKETGETINCQLVGLTAGVHPNIDLVKESTIEANRGILINHYFETNIANVYAIGDCAEFRQPLPLRRPVEQVWYTGKMQGEHLAQNLFGQRKAYNPGPWFNSAKFFDIEYQTYGMVMPNLKENETSLFWQDANAERCVHIIYDKNDKTFIGINTFGIRLRHKLFDKWLREKATVETVLQNLSAANFDTEFYKTYEAEILKQYQQQTGILLKAKTKRSLKHFFNLMKN